VGLRGPHALGRKYRPSTRRISRVEPTATPAPIRSNAGYQRVYRRRQREGKLVVSIEVDEQDIETLLAAKTLDAHEDFYSRQALAQAVKDFLRLARYA
jgi:hypothetical protein